MKKLILSLLLAFSAVTINADTPGQWLTNCAAVGSQCTTKGGGGGGGVTEVFGISPVVVTDPTTTPNVSIATNPTFLGDVTADSFKSVALGNIAGAGSIEVQNGLPIILGTDTLFTQQLGYNSAIIINSVPYTIQQIISNTAALLSIEYAGIDDTGLSYNIDAPFFTMTSSAGVPIGNFSNSGALEYPGIPSVTYFPLITAGSPNGISSTFAYNADTHNFNVDSEGQFALYANGQPMFTVQGATGNGFFGGELTTLGDVSIGQGSTPGQTLSLQTNTVNTYIPTITSSNSDGFSYLTFQSDNFIFNMDSGGSYSINGPTFLNGNFLGNGFVQGNELVSVTDIISYESQFAQLKLDQDIDGNPAILATNSEIPFMGFSTSNVFNGFTSPVNDWDIITFLSVGTDTNNNYKAIQFESYNGSSNWSVAMGGYYDGTTFVQRDNTINFDIPGDGLLQFSDSVNILSSLGIGNLPTGNYGLEIFNINQPAAIRLDNVDSIPITPDESVVFFSQFDSDLGKSVAYYLNDSGEVVEIGAGGGAGGTVTLVDTTSDLSVDGTPAGNFSVSGTLGLAPTTVTAAAYGFGNGGFTVDANGRLTAANSATNLVTAVTGSGAISSSGGTTPNITLNNTAVTAGTFQFPQITLDAQGRATAASNLGFYDNSSGVLIINGTGTSAHTGLAQNIILGKDADVSDDDAVSGIAIGNGSKAGIESVSLGLNSGAGTTGHTGAFFLGANTDATTDGLFNATAIGYEAEVGADDTVAIGRPSTSFVIGGNIANSTMHVISGTTSGSLGENGYFRGNGINDPDNSWPVTDRVYQQNALVIDGATEEQILQIPISNALGGSIVNANIKCSAILGNNGPGTSSYTGEMDIIGAFDGSPGNFYINGVSTTAPITMTMSAGTTDSAIILISVEAMLSGTTGPGSQGIEINVTGVNANFVNFNCFADYFTTQATATL